MEASTILPRTDVRTIETSPAPSVPLDSTRLLIAAEATRGLSVPMVFRGPRDLRRIERAGVGIPAYNAIDVALREGVPEVYFSRIFGPAALPASVALAGAGGASFTVASAEVGEFGNGPAGYTAEVLNGPAGGTERVVILRYGGVEVGRSTAETTRADLMTAVERIGATRRSDGTMERAFITTPGAAVGLPNVVAATNFAGGTADSGAIATADVRAALDRAPLELGPMQAVTPGRNSDSTNEELLSYVAPTERTALLEQADGLAVGAITASAAAMRALGVGAEAVPHLGGMWAQHATGPGVVAGTTRTVPWTIVMAGLIARLEAQEGHPNVAPFGDFGVPRWATGLTGEFTEADSETLLNAGVNLAHVHPVLGVRNRTFHTLDPIGASDWVDLAHTRTDRAVHAQARDVGRNMGARVIDRKALSDFGARLRGRLERMWKRGAFFGETPDQAFRVNVDTVNDTASMAAKEVNAEVGLRMSEHAEFVNITLAKVPIGQEV